MSNTGWIWLVIVAVVVIGGGIWLMNSPGTPAADTNADTTGQPASSDTGTLTGTVDTTVTTGTLPTTATVTYSGTSFTPATVTIARGGTVTFVDASTRGFWVASAMHPDHVVYDGTTRAAHCAAGYTGPAPFDECGTGSSYSFTFTKTGTFGYHDHLNATAFGKVVVQ